MDKPEEPSSHEDNNVITCQSDDFPKLENKVVYALSRLQKGEKAVGERKRRSGVTAQEIVEYLLKNYEHLDGDVESQVITALLSCIKIGFVCVEDNKKFRLLGANPRMMTSNCLTRSIHGSKCTCATLLNAVSKVKPNNCCSLQMNSQKSAKTIFKRTPAHATKSKPKSKPLLRTEREPDSGTKRSKKKVGKTRCAQKMTKRLCQPEINSLEALDGLKKCSYCLRNHGTAGLVSKMCKKCYPKGLDINIPADKFSPREEIM